MHIRKLDTARRKDVKQFIRFPFELYKDCPQWVPPIIGGMKTVLDRTKHPFYKHSQADFFVVEEGGRTLGRIAVMDHRLYNEYHGSKTAFFYYLDVVEDADVANLLFEAAFDWARQRGLQEMMGPKGLSRFDAHGLLVDGFEWRPALGVPYNHPYYEALVQAVGFEKEIDYFSGYLTADYELPERIIAIAEKVKKRRGFWIKTFRDKKEMRDFLPQAHKIYMEAFKEVPGYYPVPLEELSMTIDQIIFVAEPNMIKLVMKGDEAIGFVISYPDISAALQRCGGRLWPLGWYHLMRERKRTKWVTCNGVGLLPEYQGMGANTLLYVELGKTLKDYQRFEYGDYVQVADVNLKSMGDATVMGFPLYKTHRVYRRTL
jgi:hypothetical protein